MSNYDKYLKYLGAQLKKARIAKKLSKSALAREAHIDRSFIVRLESGKQNVSVRHLVIIADMLKIPVRYLFPFL